MPTVVRIEQVRPAGGTVRERRRWSTLAFAIASLSACSRTEATPLVSEDEPAEIVRSEPASEPVAATPEPDRVEPKPEPVRSSPALAGACPSEADAGPNAGVGVLVSPRDPVAGQRVRVIAATFDREAPLSMRIDGDAKIEAEFTVRDGVPSAILGEIASAPAGRFEIVVGAEGQGLQCVRLDVAAKRSPARPRPLSDEGVWPVNRRWSAAEEALYSAWVREMFHAPRGEELAWAALHEVTSDPARNLLHDHYGWDEDAADHRRGLYLRPDCADAPYFLRAYFAWKRGLPFAFRQCSRGGNGQAPRCGALHGSLGPLQDGADPSKPGELGAVQRYFRRTIAWGVHSGNGRTAHEADDTDFYPLALSRRSLRPGSIYADPYGHLFVLVELVPPQGEVPGILYAIDGQPDGSITRKRFWEGNFLWNPDPALGGSGFKAFRPLDTIDEGGRPRVVAATNAQIAKRDGYRDVSDEQAKLSAQAFYDRMDALITPGPRDAKVAQAEAVRALLEAAQVRVTSVDNATANVKVGTVVPMPEGHAIFETTGGWENYSTPARDLRLLVAIDLVQGFADKVARNRDVYLREGQTMEGLRAELEAERSKQLAAPDLSFTYTRSDGSPWRLTLVDVIERARAFETAYNPNDCPEVRWGAPPDSKERSTCNRRAPPDQQRKMDAYRVWFKERRRPARGDRGPSVP